MGEAGHGQASDIEIQAARDPAHAHLARGDAGAALEPHAEQVNNDIDRDKILSARARPLEYGLIDQVLTTRKRVPARSAAK